MNYNYEIVKYNKNIPGRLLMQDKPGWRCNTTPHWHDEIEIVYMIDGEMDVLINGSKRTINNGDFFFCNSKDIHATNVASGTKIYKYFVIQLSYSNILNFYRKDEQCYFDVYDSVAYHELKLQIEKLIDIVTNHNVEYADIRTNQIILEIYHILLTKCISNDFKLISKTFVDNGYAKYIMKYVSEHYMEPITLNQLGKLVGLSPQYLSKYFKKTTNMGVLQYINLIRLHKANEEVLNESSSITEAAVNNGFPSAKAYCETCKKVLGITPGRLARESKNN